MHARSWWKEYVREQNDRGKPGRVVRLFALDETSGVQRFVCSFL